MSFEALAIAHGLQIDKLYPSDRVQRCATVDKPRSKNGAFFWDGERGWVSDWSQGGEIYWLDSGKREFTEVERRSWLDRKRSMEARQEQGWRNAALHAAMLMRATKLKEHDYLMRKGLPDALGLVTDDDDLIVPMRNLETNELQGAQVIRWLADERRWEKKMLHGMRAKGAILRLGPKHAQDAFLVEGLATGLSTELAARLMRLNAYVLVCFSDSNLVHVASMLKRKAFVCADNDVSGAGQRAAEKTGLPWCMSPKIGEDMNDLHVRAGLMAVASMLMELRMRV
ncbi:MAG: hypothetical protein WC100_02475 [Sterolibacterium sp.]